MSASSTEKANSPALSREIGGEAPFGFNEPVTSLEVGKDMLELADAILDRIVHNAHRIMLQGDSMRKQKAAPLLTGTQNGEINHP